MQAIEAEMMTTLFFLVRRKRLCSLTTLLFSVMKARHVQYFATALR